MKRVRSFVVRVCNSLRATGSLPVAAPPLSHWTSEDRDQFKSFLLSTSGKRFVARLRAFESLNALSAVKSPLNIAHNGGKACGYSECVEHLISLSIASDAKTAAQQIITPVTANETPQEREARENRDLVERFSA